MSVTFERLLARFDEWLEEAAAHPHIAEPTAMTLSTATAVGVPSSRIVLLKAHDARGFGFYTNGESRKGEELRLNPRAALLFYWMPLGRQLRIEGAVEVVSAEEADAYFSGRPRESRLGAWASEQSRVMPAPDALSMRLEEARARFEGVEVPRPPHWRGYRVRPSAIEFWEEGEFRLHRRERYTPLGYEEGSAISEERWAGMEWRGEQLFP